MGAPLLHLQTARGDLVLLSLLTLAGLLSAGLLGVAVAAFLRRRSRPYLLIALAIAALFGRSVTVGLTAVGLLPSPAHHLIEHGLDVVLVALVIGAVLAARTVDSKPDHD